MQLPILLEFRMNLKGEVMIKISNLKVKKGKKEILNIDGLDTENTKYLGIFGGNGAGKTTLAKCIIGMESFEGEIVKKFPNSNTQVVLQNNGYPFYAKVKDIIMLVLNVSSLEGEIIEFIRYISFESCLNKEVGILSGGELQKLNLILVLLSKPDLLVVDEVTTGLDYETRNTIQIYISQFLKKSECKLIIISHYKEELTSLTEKVICLKEGSVKRICKPQEIELEGEKSHVAVEKTNID